MSDLKVVAWRRFIPCLIVSTIFLCFITGHAESAGVEGYILDTRKDPLEGIQVRIEDSRSITDKEGRFFIGFPDILSPDNKRMEIYSLQGTVNVILPEINSPITRIYIYLVEKTEGQYFWIDSPDNPSTGYQWSFISRGDQEYLEYLGSCFIPGKRPGSAGRKCFFFQGKTSGETSILLKYDRSWQERSVRAYLLGIIRISDRQGDFTLNEYQGE
ncbi:MAG TPA: protease inhibitor I42 family protein [Synergistales bacterium]|nr:protease inhibitor I42 family protein [Synergistales bacterium]